MNEEPGRMDCIGPGAFIVRHSICVHDMPQRTGVDFGSNWIGVPGVRAVRSSRNTLHVHNAPPPTSSRRDMAYRVLLSTPKRVAHGIVEGPVFLHDTIRGGTWTMWSTLRGQLACLWQHMHDG
ncbi:hypothetical protein H310_13559 [Aphanomyces invadans]|uniref:Uncharacterized protein n=1 Tax=Aphanomyces invadans TaxID=157072 RepID=A0A024TDG2_9STRA|nr:hypothetical protein H310_13559 [Aphanomyces invadans]ETV92034.1 hypothetical protein H310_13559 [Aphanomyces invadans]|eukprot:XP_008879331.1 hypothetical protein H310_13559 [Aphanomyces invadans]